MHQLIVAALSAAFLFPGTAVAAGGNACKKQATVTEGVVVAIDTQTAQPGTEPVTTLRREAGSVYAVPSDQRATVVFQGVTYKLSPKSEFMLGCFGENRNDGARFPRVVLGKGKVTVETTKTKPGAVSNQAGMAGPVGRPAMAFTVTAVDFAHMTVTVKKATGDQVNITPYAGKRKGTCRHITRSATLDAEKDTAVYDGGSVA
jgi:hypothetical protein